VHDLKKTVKDIQHILEERAKADQLAKERALEEQLRLEEASRTSSAKKQPTKVTKAGTTSRSGSPQKK
jgi:hypothetical protein